MRVADGESPEQAPAVQAGPQTLTPSSQSTEKGHGANTAY